MLRLLLCAGLLLLSALAAAQDEVAAARKRWAESPHGPMLERLLPPAIEPAQLPERASPGAALVLRYCVQCHNLPNPAMHAPQRWPSVVDRMVLRMRGRGNMGTLMADMMAGVEAPTDDEASTLLAYLRRNGQKPLDAREYPEVERPAGEAFRLACGQCHVLPDPKRHTAAEWGAVVARMQRNMAWMNRVVGTQPPRDRAAGEPQLRIDEILAFLRKYARR